MKQKNVNKRSAEQTKILTRAERTELAELLKKSDEHWIKKEQFLARHGQAFQRTSPTPKRYRIPGTQKKKLCYENAVTLAMHFPLELAYVEGVAVLPALRGIIPTDHAWCVDRDGKVIDPTWKYEAGQAYRGVAIDLTYIYGLFAKNSARQPFLYQMTPDFPVCAKHTKWKANLKRLRKPAMNS